MVNKEYNNFNDVDIEGYFTILYWYIATSRHTTVNTYIRGSSIPCSQELIEL